MKELCVLMATFNDAEYLPSAVESILSQTYSNFEFIIVDDGSTDSTPGILRMYAARDSRIRVITNHVNVGLAASLNTGLAKTDADYVARMDADDIALPQRLEMQLKHLESFPETDILGTYAEDINRLGERTGRIRRMPVGTALNREFVWTNPIIHPTVLFRADKIKQLSGYDERLRRRQDYDLWFRAIEQGLTIDNIPEVLLLYRETSDTFRKNGRAAMWQQAKIGLRGTYRVGGSPMSYVGILIPFFTSLLPVPLRRVLKRGLTKVDPRYN